METKNFNFPKCKVKKVVQRKVQNTDGFKYYTRQEVRLLRRAVRKEAEVAKLRKTRTAILEWAIVDVATATGARVSEIAALRCGDIRTGYGKAEVFIRSGKGYRSRTIQVPDSLKSHLNSFLKFKKEHGEDTSPEAFLFVGQRGPLSSQGIQLIVKKYLRMLNLYERGKSIHSLRHAYAVELYRREHDLRAVMRQLGHSSLQSTMIYADTLPDDVRRQVKGMWGHYYA